MEAIQSGPQPQEGVSGLFYRQNLIYLKNEGSKALEEGNADALQIYRKVRGILSADILSTYDAVSGGATDRRQALNSLIGHNAAVLGELAAHAKDIEGNQLFWRMYYTFAIEGRRFDRERMQTDIEYNGALDELTPLKEELSKLIEDSYTDEAESSINESAPHLMKVLGESRVTLQRMVSGEAL